MKIKNKNTGEIAAISNNIYEVSNAFIDPLRCYYKKEYEIVKGIGCRYHGI